MDRDSRTILVTGAAGQSGQAVLAEFARRGVPARALVRDASKAAGLRDLAGVEVIEGDMLQPLSLGPALDGVDRALMISTANPALVETQCTFVDAAKAAGLSHVVKFSGVESGIGFKPENFRFTRNHEQVERYLQASGLAWTQLRPSQFMQVYLREAGPIAAHGVLALPAADITLSPVDIHDIAQVVYQLLTTDGHAGNSYEMTGPEALTMAEIAATISEATGKPVRYLNITPEQRRQNMLAAGVPTDIADALFDQAVGRLKHPKSRISLETHAMFGVRPTTFAEFIQRHKQLFT
jgi:uncharacterized protein YbjT (DUF2867 family)